MRPKLFSRELVGLLIILFSAFSVAYLSGFAPTTMGHSSGEIQLNVNAYVNNCTSGSSDGSCVATCGDPSRERAVSGNCVSDLAYAFTGYGITDASGNMISWDCTDRLYVDYLALKATVFCLEVGGVI